MNEPVEREKEVRDSLTFMRSKRQDDSWHVLESASVGTLFPVNTMICGYMIRGKVGAMTTWDGTPQPTPLCLNCARILGTKLPS